MSRRCALGLLFGAGLGVALTEGERLRRLAREVNWGAVWTDWRNRLSEPLPGESEYGDFLARLDLQRVSVGRVLASHDKVRDGITNCLPPRDLWNNLKPTLVVAERIGVELGESVKVVVSAYRSPAYNAKCPGATPHSQHLRNVAMDLVYSSRPSRVAEVARQLRSAGVFRGGIGEYASFVHVDTRGTNADWAG